ncbi:MAG TPA: phosphoribosylaminoimidazolesuccinocarboxamide synthase [bacterium]|nr:phosphoribosylaminoimidazolesuccinocarboxamide synthase [bacterium]
MDSATRDGVRLAVTETNLDLPLVARGKVRDIYEAAGRLLIVATDRLSAFDCVLPTGIPDRGRVLTGLSAFWFEQLRGVVPNHYITIDPDGFPPAAQAQREILAGRAMLVERCRRIDFECVVRGYLAGSAWKEYRETGRACGVALPAGLALGSRLPEPIFTPATKNDRGHDENITGDEMAKRLGAPLARRLEEASLALYRAAAAVAEQAGFILVDTKFEFGLRGAVGASGRPVPSEGDEIVLIDEAVTPDSSRFWDARTYAATGSTESYDKQVVRDYLESTGWNKRPPAPALPPEVVAAARGRYLDVYQRITGRPLVER